MKPESLNLKLRCSMLHANMYKVEKVGEDKWLICIRTYGRPGWVALERLELWADGKENGNYYIMLGIYWVYMGIPEKNIETNIAYFLVTIQGNLMVLTA